METMKFKKGDKVRVKSLEWYNQNKDGNGYVYIGQVFTPSMSEQCGSILTIKEIYEDYYLVKENTKTWQDWMLEEKPVTEEKPEVEQENKNSMETKLMTKEEVFEYLTDTKILCTSREESKNVQEKLFALGFCYYGEKSNVVEDSAFILYVNIHNKMQYGSDLSVWVEDDSRRVEPNEILAIQLKEEKPKFDPKTLQPFDKVLVKDCAVATGVKEWVARFFDFYIDNKFSTTSGSSWFKCVPYNEETKHLHGTIEEEPEFYKLN
jgi:hypothetical protein